MTNAFAKRGLISKKVPAPIVRITHASIATVWETSYEEVVDTIFVRKGNTIVGPCTCVRTILVNTIACMRA